ncbi:unnamed protein product [Moneuplotes crassus]|uniref:Uncharacterized protein n=1 Tax=Euplotes crassus TaxID=5936 RepID=A0AAD1XR92_EUPCR|nr:unnamed protein product [Moneuplotes crassus]
MAATLVASSTVLSESGSYRFTIDISANAEDSNNTDVTLGLILGSTTQPLTNNYYVSGACVDVISYNYELSSDSITLKGFGIEWKCAANCNSLEAVYDTVNFYAGAHWGGTTNHVISSQSTLTAVTSPAGVNSNNSTAKTVSHTWTSLNSSQLANTITFPDQNETWYVRCFGKFNHATSVNFAAGITDLSTSLGREKNVTLIGRGHRVTAAIVAIAGSLTALVM